MWVITTNLCQHSTKKILWFTSHFHVVVCLKEEKKIYLLRDHYNSEYPSYTIFIQNNSWLINKSVSGNIFKQYLGNKIMMNQARRLSPKIQCHYNVSEMKDGVKFWLYSSQWKIPGDCNRTGFYLKHLAKTISHWTFIQDLK